MTSHLGSRGLALFSLGTAAFVAALFAAPAHAQVRLPSGQVVPVDSANGEQQLFTFFSARGEPLDWVADASATPDVFSPLCGFTATLLLHEAGSSLAVGWYNVVSGGASAPTAAEVHVIVPAGAAIGSTVTGADIRADPAYAGGLIGLALVRSPLHFTEARWNTVCSGGPCAATPGPWILSLSYPSRLTENAWYVAFEDGDTSSASWNNDGDYNDYVFYFTGLSCAGAGEPCSVSGALGVCASGLTECDTGGALSCVATTTPGTERCNGADDDCDGVVDGDGLCPALEICLFGACRPPCFEGSCNADETCTTEGICLESACTGIPCSAGERCRTGTCVGVCSGVVCPGFEVCLGGRCSDPCDGVTCGTGRVCDRGVCVEDCDCRACAAGLSCATSGECVDAACVGVSCGAGTFCRGGACVDACDGAVCPDGQVCTAGACVDVATGTDAGSGVDGGGGVGGPDGSIAFDGGGIRRGVAGDGCGCRAASARSSGLAYFVTALVVMLTRRRPRAARLL